VVKSNSVDGRTEKSKFSGSAFLNIDKPKGITSHDVVHRVRKLTGIKQVGHAGTLDPMATGVMVVALGKACRLLRFLDDDKSYLATITLGITTDTDDIEGKVLSENAAACKTPPSLETVEKALAPFRGEIEQVPPYYSAIHVDGKRLYELARSGAAPPEIKPRAVTIHSLDLVSYEAPLLTIRVHCSKGTYIRSIARDLGEALGLGGTLSALRRETSGRFKIDSASSLDQLSTAGEDISPRLISVENALNLPLLTFSPEQAKRLTMGQKIAAADTDMIEIAPHSGEQFFLAMHKDSGLPFCIARSGVSDVDQEKYFAPEVVFADV